MNLAKIRQKAMLGQNPPSAESPAEPLRKEIPDSRAQSETAALPQSFTPENNRMETAAPVRDQTPCNAAGKSRPFNPLQRILEGRDAAGCDVEQSATTDQAQSASEDYEEYLCIRVSDETYGINIMQLKEIIKPREVTEVPCAPLFVSGVISLRGVIIPILDMVQRLGLKHKSVTGKERVVVVKQADTFSGLLVDEVIKVVRIPKECFEAAPAVLEGMDRDFVSGIGRADNRMIILLNLQSITNINMF